MAPRTAKAKKTSSTKAAENGVVKKGKAIAKTVDELGTEAEAVDEAPVIEKKTKRNRKAEGDTNGLEETNGVDTLPSKKGKKNKTEDSAQQDASNNDKEAAEDDTPNLQQESVGENESNGNSEEIKAKGKKPTKKELAATKSKMDSKTSSRSKNNAKQETESEVTEQEEPIEVDEKPKPAGKSRSRKAPQKTKKDQTPEEKHESVEEEIKTEPSKGKKRGQTKSNKEKTPESEQDVQNVEEDTPAEEPKKKETKAKKTQGKKSKQTENGDEGEEKQEPATKKRKVTKKEKKDEVTDDKEPTEEAPAEPKPVKGKRGQKKAEAVAEADDTAATGDAASKRRRKAVDEKVSAEDTKKKAPPKNKSTTDYETIDFSNSSKNAQGKEWNLKIASWNVDGIRAWMSKGGLDYIKYEKPDILCLQETKCAKDKLPDEVANLPGYHAYWQGSDKDGYAGVGIYTTKLAMNVQYGLQNEELDNEGRIITAEYEQFYLICTYVPNAGRKLVTLPKRLQWNEEFRKHVNALNAKKPVIICGDMNVAHNEIDLSNPKTNKKNAGFTEEERAGMSDLLGDGFVDTYRRLHPEQAGAYTFWTYMMNSRAKNVGWRLDYFLMSERLLPALCDSVIRSEVYGSDHCPIALYLHITSADKPKE